MRTIISKTINETVIDDVRSLRYTRDASGAEITALQGKGIPREFTTPSIRACIREIEQITGKTAKNIMINRLEPGGCIPKHKDDDDYGERWHLPIVTNDEASWWDEVSDRLQHMPFGRWTGPVPYRKFHEVRNDGDQERIHLVVDLI